MDSAVAYGVELEDDRTAVFSVILAEFAFSSPELGSRLEIGGGEDGPKVSVVLLEAAEKVPVAM